MVFDFCISNPAFNVAEENNVAGTGGYTTLYRTATRNDFTNRVKAGGSLINITLKGIIPDLTNGHFKDYQTGNIHLMDNIDVWPYNTCYFMIDKKPKISQPKIIGGMASKIYTVDPLHQFDFVYNSGSNNSMNKWFNPNGKNRVVRKLPGRNNNLPIYDTTDVVVDTSPKFAFTVMESTKSHYVTDEMLYGGTICYVKTKTLTEAEKLKLFVQKNPVFREYVKRMKMEKNHSFSLRNVKKFDLNQIVTGLETPIEWGITPLDLAQPTKFINDITEDRDRVKALGEVFTPTSLVEYVLDDVEQNYPTAFKDPTITFIDSMCGDGQFLVSILKRKLKNNIPYDVALSTIYGIDLTQSNVDASRRRLLDGNSLLQAIVDNNIVCDDSLSNKFSKNDIIPNIISI